MSVRTSQSSYHSGFSTPHKEVNSSTKANNEVLILTINLGNSKDDIVIHEFDDPNILAKRFCEKHNLGLEVESTLAEHIIFNLEKVLQDLSNINQRLQQKNSEENFISNENVKKAVTPKPRVAAQERVNESRLSKQSSAATMVSYEDKSPSRSFYKNPGNRLYQLGMIQQKDRENKSKLYQQQKMQKELEEVTFTPRINTKRIKKVKNTENLLIEKGKKVKEVLKLKIKDQLETDRRKCTFTPELNPVSSRLAARDRSADRINYLCKEKEESKKKIQGKADEYFKELCPFTPNKIYKSYTKSELNDSIDRLTKSKIQSEDELEKLREKHLQDLKKDPVTGQEFFTPQINKGPRTERQYSNVWEDLYYKRSNSQSRLSISPQKTYKNARSEKIMKKLTGEKYYEIFQKLKPQKGKILHNEIDASLLERELLLIIQPLIDEMKSARESLSFEEFCGAMDALMKVLTPQEKNYLIFNRKKPENDNPLTSRSQSPSSRAIFQTYDRLMKHKRNLEEKLEEQRRSNEEKLLSECTFMPNTRQKLEDSFRNLSFEN
ncbi:unnamed protein product [Blepharisma stoltei]|uniref:Uncharacterized protein n=1 Tax=Blepharisma stoltei TaxID=1481888 RepID=A0AAU9K6P6_9CILI|nr:unnamed protein product [Blepharisma stoltei]